MNRSLALADDQPASAMLRLDKQRRPSLQISTFILSSTARLSAPGLMNKCPEWPGGAKDLEKHERL